MASPGNPQILIVEDDPDIAHLLGRVFRMGGYTTIWAPDGIQALERLEVEQPDLMTLDMNMPHMSGFEVLAQLRAAPRHRELPVIILTSRGILPQQVEAQASMVMTKPFDISALLVAVRAILAPVAERARAVGE